MKKSLFIVNDFPPILGGQSSYLYNLCKRLPPEEICVLAPSAPNDAAFDRKQSFEIIRKPYLLPVPWFEKIVKIVLPFFYAHHILKEGNFCYVHCAHVLSTGFVGLALKKLFNYSYILYTHSSDILEYQKFHLIKKVLIKILHNAHTVVCNSRFTKMKLLELDVPEKNIVLIHPSIDFNEYSKEIAADGLKDRYNLQDKKIILSINRLVERKGNDMVIQALPMVKKAIPQVHYVIAGNGPHREELDRIVKELSVGKNVTFISDISHEDTLKLYNLSDVFIMASRELKDKGDAEGFGVVFLEANAAGKPVVGGNSGGIPDAIMDGENGLLVDPSDPKAIADSLIRLLQNPDLARSMGEKGRDRVREGFNSQNPVKELTFLFHQE